MFLPEAGSRGFALDALSPNPQWRPPAKAGGRPWAQSNLVAAGAADDERTRTIPPSRAMTRTIESASVYPNRTDQLHHVVMDGWLRRLPSLHCGRCVAGIKAQGLDPIAVTCPDDGISKLRKSICQIAGIAVTRARITGGYRGCAANAGAARVRSTCRWSTRVGRITESR